MVALTANAALAGTNALYGVLFAAQGLCYVCAALGWLMERVGKRTRSFYIPYYFVYIHLAAFIAVVQALAGRRVATWTPTQREARGASAPGSP